MNNIKVRKDDDRLAHGVVKSLTMEMRDMESHAFRRIQSARNLTEFVAVVASHYDGKVLTAQFSNKLTGSRAKGRVLAFDPKNDGSGDYRLFNIGWRAEFPHVYVNPCSIVIKGHCIARYIQRVLGVSDIGTAISAIGVYIGAMIKSHEPFSEGQRVSVCGPDGRLCLVKEGRDLVAKTFITGKEVSDEFTIVTKAT